MYRTNHQRPANKAKTKAVKPKERRPPEKFHLTVEEAILEWEAEAQLQDDLRELPR